MIDWNEITGIATAAAAIAAIIAVIVTVLQQRDALADQVRALASEQRRDAYSSLLSAMFRAVNLVSFRWSEAWVFHQWESAFLTKMTLEMQGQVADADLRNLAEDIIREIVNTESRMGIEPHRQTAVIEPIPPTITLRPLTDKLCFACLKFSTAVDVSVRAIQEEASESLFLAVLAGAPPKLISRVSDTYHSFVHEAEHSQPFALDSEESRNAANLRVEKLDALLDEMTKDLQPKSK